MDFSRNGTIKKEEDLRSLVPKAQKKLSFNLLRFVVICVIGVMLIGVSAGIGGFIGVLDSAPSITPADVQPQRFKSVVYYEDGTVANEFVGSEANRDYADIEEIPKMLQYAFVVLEDERFYEHHGIDPKGILRAFVVGVSNGDFSEGASTITQQLIKLTVFDGGGESDDLLKFKRKFQEQYLALKLEEQMSKDEILEAYLNIINLGCGSYGVAQAAERYFGKNLSELTIAECAVIASIAQSPYYNDPIYNQENNDPRRNKVIGNLLDQGYITQEEYDDAIAEDVYGYIAEHQQTLTGTDNVYSWYEDVVLDEVQKALEEKLGYTEEEATTAIWSKGLQIYIPQDRRIQEIVDRYYLDDSNFAHNTYQLDWAMSIDDPASDDPDDQIHYSVESLSAYIGGDGLYSSEEDAQVDIQAYKDYLGVKPKDIIAERLNMVKEEQSSFVLIEQSTGKVLALVGGRGEKTGNRVFNRATDSVRQPGSVFKVLAAFLPALDTGIDTLATSYQDVEYSTPSGQPISNWYNSYTGRYFSIREAISYSQNIVATRVALEDVGNPLSIQYIEDMGITTLVHPTDDASETLALGGITNGVTNLELTNAYAAIANGGTYTEPIFFTKILDRDGNVLLDNTPETKQVIKPGTAWLLTSAMEDTMDLSGYSSWAGNSNPNLTTAGKTGTTTNHVDHWFVGYNAYYTAGIWFGYDNNTNQGTNYDHETLWANIMNEITEGMDDQEIMSQPETIQRVSLCSVSGKVASYSCPSTTEYVDSESFNTDDVCTESHYVTVCAYCDRPIGANTPVEWYRTKASSNVDYSNGTCTCDQSTLDAYNAYINSQLNPTPDTPTTPETQAPETQVPETQAPAQ